MAGLFGFVTLLFGVAVSPAPTLCAVAAPTDPATNTAASTKEFACILINCLISFLVRINVGSAQWFLTTCISCLRATQGSKKHTIALFPKISQSCRCHQLATVQIAKLGLHNSNCKIRFAKFGPGRVR
jgi:spore maturation protein SpmA